MQGSLHPLVLRGREALTRGDTRAAEAAAEERLRDDGRDIHALELRYLIQHERGDTAQSIETLHTVIGIDPRADWAHNDLAQLLLMHGRKPEAGRALRTALRINPRNARAHNLFGSLLSDTNDLASGEWHFRRALEIAGAHPDFLTNLAVNLMQQGRAREAQQHFAQADALAPGNVNILGHWSKLCEAQGDLQRASQLLDRAAAASSEQDVSLLRAIQLASAGRIEQALAIIEAAPRLSGQGQLERGRLYDRQGRHQEAWRDFIEAKRKLAAESGGVQYDAAAVEALFTALKRFFVRDNFALLPRAALRTDVPQPIFILGFPRSGTTLIEQVLSSHSRVAAAGELPFISELPRLSSALLPGAFPENLASAWTADNHHAVTLFRDYYLARAQGSGAFVAGKTHFIDKMPFNEIHLPLIRLAFPRSPIIQLVRHPLDVCVSMMANNTTHGFNCAYRIEDIAHHLASVHSLVDHYARELGAEHYVLKYESFAADQSRETRRLLEYAGLPFEDACLRFHENTRYAPTPSYAQVRQQLHTRSVKRHEHYAQYLQPFAAQLGPMMAAYRYEA